MNPSDDPIQTAPAHPIAPLQASSPMVSGWSAPAPPVAWTSPPPPEEGLLANGAGRIDPIALLKSLRRRWRIAAPLALVLGAAAAAAVWLAIPPSEYTAASRLFIPQTAPRFMYATRETTSEYNLFRQTQAVRIVSQKVLATALKRPEVQELDEVAKREDPEAWLRQALKVEFPNGAEILQISMSGQNPESLAALVNAVTDAYLNEVVNVDYNARLDRLEKLRTFWKTFKDELLKKRANLRRLAESAGPTSPVIAGAQKLAEAERQTSIRTALIQVQGELMKAETELEAAENAPRESNELLAEDLRRRVNQELDEDPEMLAHAERINELETSYKSLVGAARAPSKDAAGMQIRREMEVERKALADRAREIRPAIERAILQQSGPADDGLKTLRSQIALMKRLEAKYLGEIDQIKEEQTDMNRNSFDMGFLQTELELDEKAARDMGDEIKHAEIELEQAPPRVQSLETAQVPRVKDKDKRPIMSGVAGLGVFCFIALAIGFWEHQARRITSIGEVADGLGLPIVGTIPQLLGSGRSSKKASKALESPRRTLWNNLLIESVDATRTMLLRATQAEGLRAILITSANMGEGKSTLAGHLATSLARSGRRVLLIDGDLRRPIAHQVYEIPLAPGFCEWLRDETTFESIIHETAAPNLSLAPAGQCDATALAELARRDLRQLFDGLKQTYDYVIVDSSPVLPVVDATVIGQHVDAAVLSIMNERSRAPEVQETFELLSALGVRVLGAVMAGTKTNRRSYYSSPYAYYGVARDTDSFGRG